MGEENKPEESAAHETTLDRLTNETMDRRSFLQKTGKIAEVLAAAGLLGTLPAIAGCGSNGGEGPSTPTPPKTIGYPFELGVASGDPLPDGVVLWTRLAPRGGSMPSEPVDVTWEVAEDESFTSIVQQGTYAAEPEYAHSVHAEIEGLEPDQWYYYRFKMNDEVSPTGRTKTIPADGAPVDQLNIAFASCQNYPAGYYTAYDHLVNEDLDVVFFLGDYIYEGAAQGSLGRGHLPRNEVRTLHEYRIRYGQYKSDPSLQAAHAAFPWIVTLDDHEVKNNWGGEGPPYDNTAQFLSRRAAAFKAYYEHMPIRRSSLPGDVNMQLFRRFKYGNLVDFNVLDTRQYRTGFACGGGIQSDCSERLDPARTMLGEDQEDWLFDGLRSSSARWKVLAQQVMMAQDDRQEGPGTAFGMDKWDGYAATRNRLFDVVKENDIDNMVVLTGDSHKNWVNDLKDDFSNPDSRTLGTEFMGTSITSGGNGTDFPGYASTILAENPHIKFYNAQRGYVRCSITPERWQTDFRVVPYVETKGADIRTRASFVVENGQPGAVQM
ncbi:alkaline phosphatase D [Fodinibius roseus]|uniref:Alkaline phosphatase D n=1 Tax=Fodinibius roseus TaxID=1194090 RepID=A0A1M4V526_9BACT|nr:alkaline phosphatase D family protein [Fodinibius roseus]SHE63983.1 alkaline phosphatase D [Fodinibius roseus]